MTETLTPPAVPNRRPTKEELRVLVDEHGAAIYRVVIGIVRDPALAELPNGSLFGQPFTVTAPPQQG